MLLSNSNGQKWSKKTYFSFISGLLVVRFYNQFTLKKGRCCLCIYNLSNFTNFGPLQNSRKSFSLNEIVVFTPHKVALILLQLQSMANKGFLSKIQNHMTSEEISFDILTGAVAPVGILARN